MRYSVYIVISKTPSPCKDPWLPTRANRERPETSLTASLSFLFFCSASPTLKEPDTAGVFLFFIFERHLEQDVSSPERGGGKKKKWIRGVTPWSVAA